MPAHGLDGTVRSLLPGTYYWSVQTVDNSFAGSAFSAEKSFVITDTPFILSTKILPTGSVSLVSSAVPGSCYSLEGSFDLQVWTGLQTNVATGATTIFSDDSIPRPNKRFYRIRRLP